MRRALPLLFLSLALPVSLRAEPLEIVSPLKAEPVAIPLKESGDPFRLERAPEDRIGRLPVRPGAGDRVFSGTLTVLEDLGVNAEVVLVEPAQGPAFFYADQNLDGRLSMNERFPLGRDQEEGAVLLRFPVNATGLPYYPVLIGPMPKVDPEADHRELMRSGLAYLSGTITVAGREIAVRYPIHYATGEVSLGLWGVGMDTDGDGRITDDFVSGELDHGKSGTIIFKVGDLYLSTSRLDVPGGRAFLRVHPASDYRRFDLRPGSPIDFDYTDPEGNRHRLSDLRGSAVLLDFWGTWCVHCIQEMPVLRKAYASYRDLGFEILGMDAKDDLAKLQAFLAEKKDAPWLHATADSVKEVIEERFRVRAYPTKILLDRDGRIVAAGSPLDAPSLYGEAMLKTVAEVVARPPAEYVGKLDPEPAVEPRQGAALGLFEGPQAGLPVPPSPGDRTFAGKIFLRETEPSRARVVLVEPASGGAFVYADLNQDDRLSAEERFDLKREPDGEWESVTLRFPLKVGAVKEALVYLGRPVPEKKPEENVRRMAYNVGQAVGTVQVDTREVRVRYWIDLDTGQVDIASSQAMDLDGSGTFDRGLARGEVEVGDGVEPVVFHVGDYYLSARSVDLATGRIVLRTHPASDYQRFELAAGSVVPDFDFTGVDGKPRKLSELRGKVVLLDFWGTWCGPCVADLPKLRKIHEAYRGQGFEILGLPFEDDLDTLKKFLAENDAPWVHATASSVADLVRNRFRVFSFPTKILLDREGQVLLVGEAGQPALKTEDDLRRAVEEALARPRTVEYQGRLDPGLVPEPHWGAVTGLNRVPEAVLAELPAAPAAPASGDRAFEGKIWLRRSQPPTRLVLVE
ncbi:MAG TPA: TlpA disulfide reductase family protein, partial [Thermoanaerobaculia bacterium]|nr:TlpA disulfide reductase family protein [Thermoanaerobaculia bacterium]